MPKLPKNKKKSVRIYRLGVLLSIIFIFTLIALYVIIPKFGKFEYRTMPASVATTTQFIHLREATHISTPNFVRGIYMTSCVAATPSLRNNLVRLIDETELNTVVIDIKSYDGHISFMPTNENLKMAVGGCFVRDMQDFVDDLHSHNIYVVGRLAVFQDQLMVKLYPELAVKKASATSTPWTDFKGISWIDPSVKSHWDYTVALARSAHNIGFDEINFDYIRFPADGNMRDIWYPQSGTKKSDIMRSFYEYLRDSLSPAGIVISADLFGMTTTNTDDLNIGQILENALPYFDYISPMVYPSHYPPSFMNLGNPNEHVYEVVKISMDSAVARTIATTTAVILPNARIGTTTPAVYAKPSFDKNKMRPWLQDNNYPVPYTAEMVRAQIQATYDSGLNSWMLWNAGNRYTKAALEIAQ
ncbi:MAG: putative glycoside hydrolase [bacterium]|nr:putative glycoside hydrolase [bacterium]